MRSFIERMFGWFCLILLIFLGIGGFIYLTKLQSTNTEKRIAEAVSASQKKADSKNVVFNISEIKITDENSKLSSEAIIPYIADALLSGGDFTANNTKPGVALAVKTSGQGNLCTIIVEGTTKNGQHYQCVAETNNMDQETKTAYAKQYEIPEEPCESLEKRIMAKIIYEKLKCQLTANPPVE